MAKQKESSLHWFKFKVLPWNTGDIQNVSYHLKGVFSDLMAYYWSRQCNVSVAQADKKFKHGNVKNLCEAGVVKVDGERLRINFLDDQWAEVQATSLENKEKANKRWGKNESSGNAGALPQQSKSNANKKREEEIRTEESEKGTPKGNFFKINDQIFAFPPSEYFVTNFASFYESYQRTHKDLAAAALKKMDQDYGYGYTFNDVVHVRNAYRTTIEKMEKQLRTGTQGASPATGYTRHQKPTGA